MSSPLSLPRHRRFLVVHVLFVPACLGLIALIARASGLDDRLAAAFFDPATTGFPARQWTVLELLGHRVAKSAAWGAWLLLLTLAASSWYVPRLRTHGALLWTLVAAMALGPVLVVMLKGINSNHCPWDLARFGGYAQATSDWFVSSIEAGQCFPSGHAAAGFCLIAVYFAGVALGQPSLARAGLLAAITAGCIFSAVRMVQGAHFLSHNLWSAAIAWCAAALTFAPLLLARPHAEEGR